MKSRQTQSHVYYHRGESRRDVRFNSRFKKRNKNSYLALPNEVIAMYRSREISAPDLRVFSALCSLRRELTGIRVEDGKVMYGGLGRQADGVRVSQSYLAEMCGLTRKTVSASINRLADRGLIVGVCAESKSRGYKKSTNVYILKPLPKRGFFFCPRTIFMKKLSNKQFAVMLFMYRARSVEYNKSWNSYNDICEKLGFGASKRSEVVKPIGELVSMELVRKTVRKIKGAFVDNIYRVAGFSKEVAQNVIQHRAKENRPSRTGTTSSKDLGKRNSKNEKLNFINHSIPQINRNVNPLFIQLQLGIDDYILL
jgi:DNA-binding MarR family transcriptional regulator